MVHLLQALGEGNRGQRGAPHKPIHLDPVDPLGDLHRGDVRPVVKGALADGGDGLPLGRCGWNADNGIGAGAEALDLKAVPYDSFPKNQALTVHTVCFSVL